MLMKTVHAEVEGCTAHLQSDNWGDSPDSAVGAGTKLVIFYPSCASRFAGSSLLMMMMNAESCARWKITTSVWSNLMPLPVNDLRHRLATIHGGTAQVFSLRSTESYLPSAMERTDVKTTGDPTSHTSRTVVNPADKRLMFHFTNL